MSRPTRSSALWILGCLLIFQLAISMSSAESEECDYYDPRRVQRLRVTCHGYSTCTPDNIIERVPCLDNTGINPVNHMCDIAHKCTDNDLEAPVKSFDQDDNNYEWQGEEAKIPTNRNTPMNHPEDDNDVSSLSHVADFTPCDVDSREKFYSCLGWSYCLRASRVVGTMYCPKKTGWNMAAGKCDHEHACRPGDFHTLVKNVPIDDNHIY